MAVRMAVVCFFASNPSPDRVVRWYSCRHRYYRTGVSCCRINISCAWKGQKDSICMSHPVKCFDSDWWRIRGTGLVVGVPPCSVMFAGTNTRKRIGTGSAGEPLWRALRYLTLLMFRPGSHHAAVEMTLSARSPTLGSDSMDFFASWMRKECTTRFVEE